MSMMSVRASILAATLIFFGVAACGQKTASAPAASGPIEITVTQDGIQPDKITVKKGEPITFAFTRTTDKTCAKEVVLQVAPNEKIEKALPLNQRVEVTATFPQSGEVKYACGMDMVSGVITVQ